jgi:hypothetical protein
MAHTPVMFRTEHHTRRQTRSLCVVLNHPHACRRLPSLGLRGDDVQPVRWKPDRGSLYGGSSNTANWSRGSRPPGSQASWASRVAACDIRPSTPVATMRVLRKLTVAGRRFGLKAASSSMKNYAHAAGRAPAEASAIMSRRGSGNANHVGENHRQHGPLASHRRHQTWVAEACLSEQGTLSHPRHRGSIREAPGQRSSKIVSHSTSIIFRKLLFAEEERHTQKPEALVKKGDRVRIAAQERIDPFPRNQTGWRTQCCGIRQKSPRQLPIGVPHPPCPRGRGASLREETANAVLSTWRR